MGTTVVVFHLNGHDGYVGHVGDSRCYRLRDGEIVALTRDHSLLEDWKDARPDLTEHEIRDFPHKNVITRALGMRDTVDVDVTRFQIKNRDRFLLCSDCLCGMLTDEEMHAVIQAHDDPEECVAELIDHANAEGGEDNITAMLIECLF